MKKVTRKAKPAAKVGDPKSPLKKSFIDPVHEPETPTHRSPHGKPEPAGAAHAMAKKGKKDGKRRPRNKGRS